MSTPTKAIPVAAITSAQVRELLEKCDQYQRTHFKTEFQKVTIVPGSIPLLSNPSVLYNTEQQMGNKSHIVAGVVQYGADLQVFIVCFVNSRTFVNVRSYKLPGDTRLLRLNFELGRPDHVDMKLYIKSIYNDFYTEYMDMQYRTAL